MDDDTGSPEDERAVELSTIAAIFPELSFDPADPFTASIDLPVTPAKPLAVRFLTLTGDAVPNGIPTPPNSESASDETLGHGGATLAVQNVRYLSHLPPITLKVSLPCDYPAKGPPVFHLASQLSWIPDTKLQELETAGHTTWEDMGRDQTVYAYIDYLQQQAENCFGLLQSDGDTLELPKGLEISLLDYDIKAKRTIFEQQTFECGVCLEPKKGSVCHRLLLCSHVFCVGCLRDFYNNCITEGDITNVKCLAPNCDKEANVQPTPGFTQRRKRRRRGDRTLDPSELLQIPLDQETVQRYVKLKRKKMLESDRTTVYCPRQWCQGAARSKKYPKVEDLAQLAESESEGEEELSQKYDPNANQETLPPPSERLAICEDCSFAFCKVCKSGWHGEFARCFPRRQYELTAEEKATAEYMKAHTTACPTCDARCQKTMGCNHMICFKCNAHFCYLCSAWLMEDNPYVHFNTPWTSCYMRLWELEEGDGIGVVRAPEARAPPVEVEFVEETDDEVNAAPPAPAPPQVPAIARRANGAVNALPQAVHDNPNGVRVNARIQQGLARPQPILPVQNRGPPVQGLQRFLRMVENDEEDEWDSDELDEHGNRDDERWDIILR